MSASPTDDRRDINDIFDDITATEENARSDAYQRAYEQSRQRGNSDGYHLGFHRGAEYGAELGYYAGVISCFRHHLLSDAVNSSDSTVARIQSAIVAVETALAELPATNDADVDIIAGVTKVRALFKRLSALLKFRGRYPGAGDSLDF